MLRIPVELAVSFVEGTFTAKNGLLSDKASKGQPVTDLTATLTSHKEKAKLVVNVSGLEQVSIRRKPLYWTVRPSRRPS